MAGALHKDGQVIRVQSWEEFSIFGGEDVWILIWGIPLDLWYEEFLISAASVLGSFIDLDP